MPLPYRWLPGHWLCSALDRLATTIDPTTYLGLIRHPVRDGLIQLGAPAFIANVLGASSGYGLKLALGQRPVGQLIQTLRVLGALTCPTWRNVRHDVKWSKPSSAQCLPTGSEQ